MNYEKLFEILNSSGIPFRYHHFEGPPPIPYGVYLFTGADAIYADGITPEHFDNIRIELYTEKKSPETEKQLEDKLKENEIAFEIVGEAYIKEEKLFMKIYEI